MPICYLQTLFGRSLFWSIQSIFPIFFHQWSCHSDKSGIRPIHMLLNHHGGWYLYHTCCWFFTFLLGLPRPSQKCEHWSQYELGVALSRNLYGPFVLNNNFSAILNFLLDFICFLNNTRSPVSNSLMIFTFFCSSLCLGLLSDTRMLNNYLCLNMSGDAASKLTNDCCLSEVPPLNIAGDRSIGNGNYLPIATTDWSMSVPSTGTTLKVYSAKNTPCNHLWRLTLPFEFIFFTLFKYLWNLSFIIALWLPLATTCTGISKTYWKVFLNIPEKFHLHPPQSFLESQMEQRSFKNTTVWPELM